MNEQHGYPKGCFNTSMDYSNHIGCYDCVRCEHLDDFVLEFKVTCRKGVSGCYMRILQDKTVERGCAIDLTFDCEAHSSCYICDTNYCNGNAPIRNDLPCYTSKPFGYDDQSTTLQLESCRGLYPKIRDDKCFLARHKRSDSISAGCIEDAPRDQSLYSKFISGNTGIIFEAISTSCFKCKSDSRENCFNVNYLKTEFCTGTGQYAIRGCYTFFSNKFMSIERGCLTELDPYLQGLCQMPRFETFCITCRDEACNTHLPSDAGR